MLFDFLFVTGDPFGVVLVLREIDIELVFSHMRGCVGIIMQTFMFILYISIFSIQYSVFRTSYSVFKEHKFKQNNKQNECLS